MATRMFAFALTFALLTLGQVARAMSYDEAVSGDLSGDRSAPTSLALDAGTNFLTGVTTQGDLDYVTVASAYAITSLTLVDYASTNGTAFIGLQAGTTFTEPNTGTNADNLLGWSHFGPGSAGAVGVELLPLMGSAIPAIGFSGPLPAGSYTFWIQQTSAAPTNYRFALVVPEPGSLALMALGIGALVGLRRRA